MQPAGHAAVLGCVVPAAGRSAAWPAVADCSGSAAGHAVVAAACFGSVGWPAAVAPVCSGSVAGPAVVAPACSGSVGWPVAVALVCSGSVAWLVVVVVAAAHAAAAGHALAAASAPASLPLVRAVRRQEQWFLETEAGLLFRELQMLSLELPQLQARLGCGE